MYTVKIVRERSEGGRKQSKLLPPCTHLEISEFDDAIRIEICGAIEACPQYITLPQDADSAYIMDSGNTIDSVHWPPRDKGRKPALRGR